jgi:predicted component of type VI protein secretion system
MKDKRGNTIKVNDLVAYATTEWPNKPVLKLIRVYEVKMDLIRVIMENGNKNTVYDYNNHRLLIIS